MADETQFLPYGRQTIEDDDIEAVVEALRSDFLTGGPAVERFESRLCEATGAPHAVAVSSGTAALHLAAIGCGLTGGDLAIAPAMTFAATANAARYEGADVVFADVDPRTGLMTPATLSEAFERAGRPVKAVFVVHLNGHVAPLAELSRIAREHGAVLIEDACHALGARREDGDERIGDCRRSSAAAFSFHPVKTVAMGEGGALTTRDGALAARLRRLRSHGMVREADGLIDRARGLSADGEAHPWFMEMQELGYNYRASDIHCALAASQMTKLPRFLARRAELARLYDAALRNVDGVTPVPRPDGWTSGWHLYAVHIEGMDDERRAALMRRLRQDGIGTQVHYIPLPRHPYYAARGHKALPGAEAYYRGLLSLPLFPAMREGDPVRVVEALAAALRERPGLRPAAA